jgi:hypothetical protein
MSGAEPRPGLIAIDQVASLLAARIQTLAPELLRAGKRDGHEWRCGSLAGDPGQSLAVHLTGAKAGVWCDFSTGETGDAMDLVAQVLFRGDKRQALHWARRWLGLESGDPAALATARREAQARSEQADALAAADAEARRRQAVALWLRGVPIPGTPVEAYLAGRGIELRDMGHVPSALRYLPDCWCAEAGLRLPAMVAAIADTAGRHVATHRTWLEPVPDRLRPGQWRKASLRDPKMTLGSYAGGFIRLARGASGKPWAAIRPGETVAFAEGIETALSVAALVPEWRVAAAVSLGNLARLALPEAVRDVVVCADRDPPQSKATEALAKALRHLLAQGARVRAERPDAPHKDWNDQLQAERAQPSAMTSGQEMAG